MTTDEQIIQALMKQRGFSRRDAEDAVKNLRTAGARHHELAVRWLRLLDHVTIALAEGTAEPFVLHASVFWVKLRGVIVELHAGFKTWAQSHDRLVKGGKLPHVIFLTGKLVYDCCVAVRDVLNDDERIFTEVARTTEAHVTQKGFAFGLVKGSKKKQRASLRRHQTMPTLDGKSLLVDDIMSRCAALLVQYGDDQDRLTVEMAKKLRPRVTALAKAIRLYDKSLRGQVRRRS